MDNKLINHLRSFNSKERFYLIGEILGNPSFKLSATFCDKLSEQIGVTVPQDSFAALDYHLDWLYASLILAQEEDVSTVHLNDNDIIKGHQEDMDFIIAFEKDGVTHIVLIEAKGVTSWGNKQMNSKVSRLKLIFEDNHCHNVKPHLVFLSPSKPQKLEMQTWSAWMKKDGSDNDFKFIPLSLPCGLMFVTRHKEPDSNGKEITKWTTKARRYACKNS